MMPTMAYNVLQSITIMANTLRQFTDRCVAGIAANEAQCRRYAESTIALATALNPYIGYAKAAELVKESVASGESIVELARKKQLLSEEQIRDILDPGKMTEPRK
jgi:aspartate ammonia-lyase